MAWLERQYAYQTEKHRNNPKEARQVDCVEWAAKAMITVWRAILYIWKARCAKAHGESKFERMEAKER